MGGLRQRPKYLDELGIGIACAVIGMCLFNLGIALGLTPLGEQLGGNVVSSFASIQPWEGRFYRTNLPVVYRWKMLGNIIRIYSWAGASC